MSSSIRNKKLRIIVASTLSIFTFAALTTSTVAWFKYGTDITFGTGSRVPIKAGAEAAFFGGGDGTEGNPYIISDRTHLYNLAWLQYIGKFNVDDIDAANPQTQIQELYFKVQLAEGQTELDMQNLTLPPIGTETYPFFGHFDGGGYTISNLKISNDNPVPVQSDFGITKPSTIPAAAMKLNGESHLTTVNGLFGVVGHIPTNTVLTDADCYRINSDGDYIDLEGQFYWHGTIILLRIPVKMPEGFNYIDYLE